MRIHTQIAELQKENARLQQIEKRANERLVECEDGIKDIGTDASYEKYHWTGWDMFKEELETLQYILTGETDVEARIEELQRLSELEGEDDE